MKCAHFVCHQCVGEEISLRRERDSLTKEIERVRGALSGLLREIYKYDGSLEARIQDAVDEAQRALAKHSP